MARIVHFELSAENPERAMEFYKKAFGWEFNKWQDGEQDYWLITTGPDMEPGINGGLLKRRDDMHCVNTAAVPSVDYAIKDITAAGGELVVPKMAIKGMGYLAYCKDTEGNIFGIMETDKNAS